MKTLKKIIAMTLLGTILYSGNVQAEDKKPVDLGYNALEVTLAEKDVRTRLLTNIDYKPGKTSIGYHGLNEITGNTDNYFGRHVITAGLNEYYTTFANVVKTTNEGIIDNKIGIRNTSLPNLFGGYGSIDLSVDSEAANLTVFLGQPFPCDISAEIYQEIEKTFGGDLSYYTELQLNKKIADNTTAFYRLETVDFNKDNATHLVGLSFNF